MRWSVISWIEDHLIDESINGLANKHFETISAREGLRCGTGAMSEILVKIENGEDVVGVKSDDVEVRLKTRKTAFLN